ncbi:MAG: hypothetical protein ACQGVC_16660 [Myxococcota bacterium]
MPRPVSVLLLAVAVAAFAVLLLGRLSHPLLWQDEGETAMFASRVLDHGFPRVHGERNVVYEFGPDVALGVKESVDAYIGKTWGDFYVAAPAVAWARRSDDAHAQAFRLRLPFALLGAVGLCILLASLLPAVPPGRRLAFAAAFFALCSASVSLQLHLREARYYGLLMAVLPAVLALHLREERSEGNFRWGRAAELAAVSFLLFHVFHVAWFATTALLASDAVLRAWRAAPQDRRTRLWQALAPHALAALLVAPWLHFFETFRVAREFASHVGLSPAGYLTSWMQVVAHFARQELLLPAALGVAAGSWVFRRDAASGPEAHGLAVRLALFCLGYTAIGCLNPLVYERYFFVLGPLLTGVALLEASALLDRAGARRRVVAGAVAALLLASLVPRVDALRGRIAELREPVRGPVDFLVAHLKERYADPSELVIATNYEAHPLMFHLGSRVIVGLSGNNLVAERELTPDVVVPRRRWPRMLPELSRFLARGGYEEVELPVRDVHYNNVPSLAASPTTPDPHRFETPHAADGQGLRVHHRIR